MMEGRWHTKEDVNSIIWMRMQNADFRMKIMMYEKMYEEYFVKPNSPKSHMLLHTEHNLERFLNINVQKKLPVAASLCIVKEVVKEPVKELSNM